MFHCSYIGRNRPLLLITSCPCERLRGQGIGRINGASYACNDVFRDAPVDRTTPLDITCSFGQRFRIAKLPFRTVDLSCKREISRVCHRSPFVFLRLIVTNVCIRENVISIREPTFAPHHCVTWLANAESENEKKALGSNYPNYIRYIILTDVFQPRKKSIPKVHLLPDVNPSIFSIVVGWQLV